MTGLYGLLPPDEVAHPRSSSPAVRAATSQDGHGAMLPLGQAQVVHAEISPFTGWQGTLHRVGADLPTKAPTRSLGVHARVVTGPASTPSARVTKKMPASSI